MASSFVFRPGNGFGLGGSRGVDRSDNFDMNSASVGLSSRGVPSKKEIILNAALAPYLLRI